MIGKISIHKYTSTEPPYRGVSIEVEDERSGVRFLVVDMSVEDFGNAILGLGNCDCTFELRSSLVGKLRENKVEKIKVKKGEFVIKDAARQQELLAPYEVDGWMGNNYDFENHHNFDFNTDTVRVTFVRYVD